MKRKPAYEAEGAGCPNHFESKRFIKALAAELDWSEALASTVLQRVLDRVRTIFPDTDLVRLPTLVRAIYFEGWKPFQASSDDDGPARLMAQIEGAFDEVPVHERCAVLAVLFRLLDHHAERVPSRWQKAGEVCQQAAGEPSLYPPLHPNPWQVASQRVTGAELPRKIE